MKTIIKLKNIPNKWIDKKISFFEKKIENKKIELQKVQQTMLYESINFRDFEEFGREIVSKVDFYNRKIRQLKLLKERR